MATAEVLAQAADPGIAGYWEGIFQGEVPSVPGQVLPELLTTDPIELKGNMLRVIQIGQPTTESTVLHTPSLAAVVTGDLAYNEVHMMTAESGEPERTQWIANLEAVAERKPAFVVAGHKTSRTTTIPRSSGNPNNSFGLLPRPVLAWLGRTACVSVPPNARDALINLPRGG